MDASAIVLKELKDVEPSTSTSLEISTEVYFDAVKGLMNLKDESKSQIVYIASTVPADAIINAMEMIGVDSDDVKFIDCISNMMTGQQGKYDNVIFIESPTMLENIMLKVEFLRRKSAARRSIVIIDSVNTLHIHNDWKIMGEFLHILVNSLRSRGSTTIILSIKEQQSPEVNALLGLVSDRVVKIGGV